LLFKSYSTSHFASLPEILYACREDSLVLGKILRGRYSFAVAVSKALLAGGQYVTSAEKLLIQTCKALCDIIATLTGLKYIVLTHRARPLAPGNKQRWAEIWPQVQDKRRPVDGGLEILG
jgi:hypothetical protein